VGALNLATVENDTWLAFGVGQGGAVVAYFLALAACHMNMGVGAFAPPILLTLPVSALVVEVGVFCEGLFGKGLCGVESGALTYVVPGVACLVVGHALAFGWNLFRRDHTLLLQECLVSALFYFFFFYFKFKFTSLHA
jgi:hypothetical protein